MTRNECRFGTASALQEKLGVVVVLLDPCKIPDPMHTVAFPDSMRHVTPEWSMVLQQSYGAMVYTRTRYRLLADAGMCLLREKGWHAKPVQPNYMLPVSMTCTCACYSSHHANKPR